MARLLTLLRSGRLDARREDGVGVPTALFVALAVFTLGATWTQIGIHDVTLSTHERAREQALNAAEAGINSAMSALTVDANYTTGTGTLSAQTGEWAVEVKPVVTTDPTDRRRQIIATGYAPTRAQPSGVRTLEAEVDLETSDGFEFGLFAGAGTISGANHMTVNGDIYATHGIALANNSDINGDIVSPAYVSTSNSSVVAGDIRAGGDLTIENSQTTVQGSVFSGGNASINGHVAGNAQAAGTISVGGVVDGTASPYSPPPAVEVQNLPVFTWDPANYSPAPATWSSTSSFWTDWSNKALGGLAFNGHHRINDTAALNLDRKWKMDADVTIVSDGKITLSKEVLNAGSGTLDLVVITTSASGIELNNNVTIPDSIRLLLFAPNGPVTFKNLKHFAGAVYGQTITVDQNFTLTFSEPDAPGFNWATSTAVHYDVFVRVLREVAAAA